MKLNEFVLRNIDISMAQGRDFTGPRGWVHLTNLLLRRIENEGVNELCPLKEVGRLVTNGRTVVLPSDVRFIEKIYLPGGEFVGGISYEKINNVLRLSSDVAAPSMLFTGNTATLTATDNFKMTNPGSTYYPDDYLAGWCAITQSGDGYVVVGSKVENSVDVRCVIDSPQAWLPITKIVFDGYVMIRYRAQFTQMTSHLDEIPIDDRYENILYSWLVYMTASDMTRRAQFQREFEAEMQRVSVEVSTPTVDQARPGKRSVPGLAAL